MIDLILININQFNADIVLVLYKNNMTFLDIEFDVCTNVTESASKLEDTSVICELLRFNILLVSNK